MFLLFTSAFSFALLSKSLLTIGFQIQKSPFCAFIHYFGVNRMSKWRERFLFLLKCCRVSLPINSEFPCIGICMSDFKPHMRIFKLLVQQPNHLFITFTYRIMYSQNRNLTLCEWTRKRISLPDLHRATHSTVPHRLWTLLLSSVSWKAVDNSKRWMPNMSRTQHA